MLYNGSSVAKIFDTCDKYTQKRQESPDYLINMVYPDVREMVAETGSQGDRSENVGYREVRRRQAKTISRIRFLQKILESRLYD